MLMNNDWLIQDSIEGIIVYDGKKREHDSNIYN